MMTYSLVLFYYSEWYTEVYKVSRFYLVVSLSSIIVFKAVFSDLLTEAEKFKYAQLLFITL